MEVSTATQKPAGRLLNGGFPEPYMRLAVKLVRVNHRDCGRTTMIRVPEELPGEAIRRVVCGGCGNAYAPARVQTLGVLEPGARKAANGNGATGYNSVPMRERPAELATRLESSYFNPPATVPEPEADGEAGAPARTRRLPKVALPSISMPSVPRPSVSIPKLSLPSGAKRGGSGGFPRPSFATSVSLPKLSVPKLSLPNLPRPRLPRLGRSEATLPAYATIPIAFAAVVIGIIAIQAWNTSSRIAPPAAAPTTTSSATPASATPAGNNDTVNGNAKIVRGSNFTIALPAGWKASTPPKGATFAAAADDGSANATLWIQDDPNLDYPTFEARSLAQLRSLAGSAHVASRVVAPTADGTVVQLAADAPAGKPVYSATLRVSGPYRYYLATTVEPDASTTGTKGTELLANSLTPVDDGVTK